MGRFIGAGSDWFDADGDGVPFPDHYDFDVFLEDDRDVNQPGGQTCPGTGNLTCGTVDMGAHEVQ